MVWRRGPTGVEVVVVHRPAYDDWTLPKGKLTLGETDEEAALREVREETGLVCKLGPEMPSTSYVDHRGREKVVRYWAMTTAAVAAEPLCAEVPTEVDLAVWLPLEEARKRLSYPHDAAVLDALPI